MFVAVLCNNLLPFSVTGQRGWCFKPLWLPAADIMVLTNLTDTVGSTDSDLLDKQIYVYHGSMKSFITCKSICLGCDLSGAT